MCVSETQTIKQPFLKPLSNSNTYMQCVYTCNVHVCMYTPHCCPPCSPAVAWSLVVGEGVLIWILLSYAQRYTLKALLSYQGWMFDARG